MFKVECIYQPFPSQDSKEYIVNVCGTLDLILVPERSLEIFKQSKKGKWGKGCLHSIDFFKNEDCYLATFTDLFNPIKNYKLLINKSQVEYVGDSKRDSFS